MPRKETLDKVPKIKEYLKLYKKGEMTIKQIKAKCQCGATLIKRVEDGEFDDPQDPQKLGSLTPLTPPPRPIKHNDPQKRRSYEDRSGSEDEWKEATKKHIQRSNRSTIQPPPKAALTACAFYIQTRSDRAYKVKRPLTSSEVTNIQEIEAWKPYIEYKRQVELRARTNTVNEFKKYAKPSEVNLKPSSFNGGKA